MEAYCGKCQGYVNAAGCLLDECPVGSSELKDEVRAHGALKPEEQEKVAQYARALDKAALKKFHAQPYAKRVAEALKK